MADQMDPIARADPYPGFSEEELARRRASVRRAMEEAELSALLLYGTWAAHDEVQYLSDFAVSWEAALIFPLEGDPTLLVEFFNHLPNARAMARVDDVRWLGADAGETIAEDLGRRSLAEGRVGFAGPISLRRFEQIRKRLPKADLVDFSAQMIEMRLHKSAEELAFIRKGAAFCDLAIEALEREVQPGMVEHDLARIVQSAYLGRGGRNVIHFMGTTPMRKPSLPVPAQHQSNRRIEKGDVLITEISAHYHGYMGQIHRPFAIGEPPIDRYRRMYEVATEAFDRVCAVIRPGASTDEVLDQAEYIHEQGFTIQDSLLHGLNGGNWLPHLWTRRTTLPSSAPMTFEESMTIVVQPAIVTPDGAAGVQVGELLHVTAEGVERMHRYPMRFVECG